MLFLGLLCAKKGRIITRQLTFAANLVTINKVSVREWRNGRRAGFRHQFQRSEGSTPFSRIKNGPKPHAWGHFLSCGEEGPNSTAARRRQAISPAGCCFVSGCGTQRLLRPLSGPCILLATAPTASPCFRRWRQSSLLQVPPCRNVYGGRCRCAAPSPCLGSFFILRRRGAEQHGRPQAASNQPGNLEESLPTRLDEHPQNPYTIRSRRSKK